MDGNGVPLSRSWPFQGNSRDPPFAAGTVRCTAPRRRIGELPVLAASAIMTALLAGCASSATTGPSAPPAQSPAATASPPAAARIFTSRHYGYTEALPAGWTGVQATHQWNGTGVPGGTTASRTSSKDRAASRHGRSQHQPRRI